jgi:carboxypeptidase Taq
VSYNLHVLIRFELEKALLDKSLQVEDLPAAWNEKYRDYLEVRVDSDAAGVLQDIHWSHGSLGYFPTYTIGNLVAAQLWESYRAVDPDVEETLRSGNLTKVRQWLSEQIHRHGSIHPPEVLITRATGRPPAAEAFLDYLHRKYMAEEVRS